MLKTKREEVSASRFCRRTIELPYASLFRYPEFTLAISKTTFYRDFPPPGRFRPGVDPPLAYGVLHQEGNIMHDGSIEPLLPVEVTFDPSESEGPLGHGALNRSGMEADATYFLNVSINDPSGTIFAALDEAMMRTVISGGNFLHLRCVRRLDHGWEKKPDPDWRKDHEAERALLKKVDRGEAELPDHFTFEKVSFNSDLTAGAPAWSWAWRDLEFDKPILQNPGTAKWRRMAQR